jgi:hemoglobin
MMPDQSLYDRLGGVFAIAAVVDKFSNSIFDDPVAGRDSRNPQLHEWHTEEAATRLAGLKFMRTLWLCEVAGGPFHFSATRPGETHLGLEEAHRSLHIKPEEFDAVAGDLARTLDEFGVPDQEKQEVLAAFAAHKGEVTEGSGTPVPA